MEVNPTVRTRKIILHIYIYIYIYDPRRKSNENLK